MRESGFVSLSVRTKSCTGQTKSSKQLRLFSRGSLTATTEMIHFVDNHRERFRIEPICRVLQFAPSTYYAARQRPVSELRLRDEALKVKIRHVHAEHFGVYGVRKLWHQLRRESIPVARCTVERLMRELGIKGVVRGKTRKTTVSDDAVERPADLVDRNFRTTAPNRLWSAPRSCMARPSAPRTPDAIRTLI